MPLGRDLLKMLSKTYQPAHFIETRFRGYDLAFKTDDQGNPVLLFIGRRNGNGTIHGQRYARRLIKDKNGQVIKDHWDDKGKTE